MDSPLGITTLKNGLQTFSIINTSPLLCDLGGLRMHSVDAQAASGRFNTLSYSLVAVDPPEVDGYDSIPWLQGSLYMLRTWSRLTDRSVASVPVEVQGMSRNRAWMLVTANPD